MDLSPYFTCIVIAFTCILDLEDGVAGYETYTVERDCPSGNLTLDLSESGPSSAVLLRTTDHTSYSVAGKCKIQLRAPERHRIVAAVRQIDFRIDLSDGTCLDFVEIKSRPLCSKLLRLEEEHHYYSEDNTMEILHYISEKDIDNFTLTGHLGAKLTLTALTPGGDCARFKDRFRCRNDFCVWSELKCDSHNNCGDRSDEEDCGTPGGSQSTVLVILGVLILLLLLIMCIATLLCSKNETVRRFSHRLRSQTVSYVTKRFSR